ncbi:hypothetical protein ACJ73_04537 [Blastomyces percursus]|uniref:Uncharacterized protein n=1 Tax=Blastomyces percursus TaxID=1658174 RepID=A0A1J9R8X9_9EURO|nr:hypothetical protein ACJ73_04537 [Blastomyces percursus]
MYPEYVTVSVGHASPPALVTSAAAGGAGDVGPGSTWDPPGQAEVAQGKLKIAGRSMRGGAGYPKTGRVQGHRDRGITGVGVLRVFQDPRSSWLMVAAGASTSANPTLTALPVLVCLVECPGSGGLASGRSSALKKEKKA